MKKVNCLVTTVFLLGLGFSAAQAQESQKGWIDLCDISGSSRGDFCASPQVKRDRRAKITPEDLKRQVPHPKPHEAYFVIEKDGVWRMVDPVISQKLD